jgi:hypothetical protein
MDRPSARSSQENDLPAGEFGRPGLLGGLLCKGRNQVILSDIEQKVFGHPAHLKHLPLTPYR